MNEIKNYKQGQSAFADAVWKILDDTFAHYNLPGTANFKDAYATDGWAYVKVVLTRRELATYDFDHLTQLVIRCHDAAVRLSISSGGIHKLGLLFHRRSHDMELGVAKRHPTIEQAIENTRGRNYYGPVKKLVAAEPVPS